MGDLGASGQRSAVGGQEPEVGDRARDVGESRKCATLYELVLNRYCLDPSAESRGWAAESNRREASAGGSHEQAEEYEVRDRHQEQEDGQKRQEHREQHVDPIGVSDKRRLRRPGSERLGGERLQGERRAGESGTPGGSGKNVSSDERPDPKGRVAEPRARRVRGAAVKDDRREASPQVVRLRRLGPEGEKRRDGWRTPGVGGKGETDAAERGAVGESRGEGEGAGRRPQSAASGRAVRHETTRRFAGRTEPRLGDRAATSAGAAERKVSEESAARRPAGGLSSDGQTADEMGMPLAAVGARSGGPRGQWRGPDLEARRTRRDVARDQRAQWRRSPNPPEVGADADQLSAFRRSFLARLREEWQRRGF